MRLGTLWSWSVQRIADLYHAAIRLSQRPGGHGLVVDVLFPVAGE